MDAMLIATTNFARLLLGSIFLANLAMWVFRYSAAGQFGTLLAIGAMAAAWLSQSWFLQHEAEGPLPDINGPDWLKLGSIARWLCAALTACASLCLVWG